MLPGSQVFVVLEDLLTQFVYQLVEAQVDLHIMHITSCKHGSEQLNCFYTKLYFRGLIHVFAYV